MKASLLADYNAEGQAAQLFKQIKNDGWLNYLSVELLFLRDLGLAQDADDRTIWHLVQKQQLILLTNNRNNKGQDSLQNTIMEENTAASLPVVTFADGKRMDERIYRERCAEHLMEIVLEIDNYRGTGRLFIPSR